MKYIFVAFLAVFLSACGVNRQALKPDQLKDYWLAQQAELAQITQWNIDGRASVATADDSGTVSMFWHQDPEDFSLKLVAPFGRGTLHIEKDEQGVKMTDPKGKVHRAATAQGLVWLKTGWNIPIEKMRRWVLGVVDDVNNPSVQVDEYGRTLAFDAGQWQVRYPSYRDVEVQGREMSLPRKVYLTSPELKVKLVVSEWTIN